MKLNNDKRGTVRKKIPKIIAVCAVIVSICIIPAFAASTPPAEVNEMVNALNTAWKWICGIFAIGAVLSIASFAFAFFFASGSKDDEDRIAKSKKKMIIVLIATAVMFLIPLAVNIGRDLAGDLAWDPEGSESNHIITPKDPSDDDSLIDVIEPETDEG